MHFARMLKVLLLDRRPDGRPPLVVPDRWLMAQQHLDRLLQRCACTHMTACTVQWWNIRRAWQQGLAALLDPQIHPRPPLPPSARTCLKVETGAPQYLQCVAGPPRPAWDGRRPRKPYVAVNCRPRALRLVSCSPSPPPGPYPQNFHYHAPRSSSYKNNKGEAPQHICVDLNMYTLLIHVHACRSPY